MNRIEKALLALGVPTKETAILAGLIELERGSVSDLARKTGLPRTTLYGALEQFLAQGFARKVRVGNHTEWEAASPDELYSLAKDNLREFKEAMPDMEALRGRAERDGKPAEVLIYKSRAGLKKAYESMFELRRHERVYVIEGGRSVQAKLNPALASYSIEWQGLFKKKGIILESVGSEETITRMKQIAPEVLRAHLDRRIIATMLPDDVMNFGSDIMVFRHTAVITVASKNLSFIIHNPEIADTFKNLFFALQSMGKRFDFNAYVRGVLEEREKE